ncbi:MAG TPA: ABC transporter permease [Candidatus Eisenbacteria bacterium]|nr:ABC transporter permease [Candidatus Eisenbacteria bacterium]
MLRAAWFIALHDLKHMLRARETILWTFIMPIVFFFFIGSITGGFGRGSGVSRDPLILETSPEAGFLANTLEQRLREAGFEIRDPQSADPKQKVPKLTIPPAFTDSVLAGHRTTITLTRPGEANIRGDYDRFRVQRAAFGTLGQLIAASETGPPTPEGLAIVAAAPQIVRLEVTPAGKRRIVPTGFEQAVPGTMVMFTLILLLTSGAVLVILERKEGLLRRLASSPLDRSTILLGKWGGRMMLGMIQIGFAMIVGTLLFHVRWGSNLPMLLVVLFFYGGLAAILGLLLGSVARSEGQAVGLGVLTSNVFAALGGCWWPIEITPSWMQKLALVFPTGWAMDALHKLVSFEAPPTSVVPHLVVFSIALVVAGWLAARVFRFQ